AVLHVAGELIDLAFALERGVVGERTGGLLDASLRLIESSSHFCLLFVYRSAAPIVRDWRQSKRTANGGNVETQEFCAASNPFLQSLEPYDFQVLQRRRAGGSSVRA